MNGDIMKIGSVSYIDKVYLFGNGYTMKREYGLTPNGDDCLDGKWVLRDENDKFLDFNTNRNDLADKFNLRICHV
jgi:hypothetical protein